jgi:hypothetical protein
MRLSDRTPSDGGQRVHGAPAPRSISERGIGIDSLEPSDPYEVSDLIAWLTDKACADPSRTPEGLADRRRSVAARTPA